MSRAASDERSVHRTCPLCEATCGLVLTVRGDDVVRVRGDDDDPLSRGFLCPKGPALADLHRDPDRLRNPLVRRGGRGGELVEASWEEAYRTIDAGLARVREQHGKSAVAAYVGNPNVHNLAGALFLRPLLKALETRQIYSASTVDQMPRHVSAGLMFGSAGTIPVPDLDHTDFLLMLGANPYESNGSLCTAPDFPGRLRALRRRGGQLVVVDPRRTRTAAAADLHLSIVPGTDAAFLLALAHVLFEEGLVDVGAPGEHVNGLDRVREWVRPFDPERVASRCGIDAETIRTLARDLSRAPSAAVYGRIGVHTTTFGTLASWASDLLNVLTGNLDRRGGVLFPQAAHTRPRKRAGGRGYATGRWHSRVRRLPEVNGELPVATLADELETPGEGRIRALFTIAGNPVLSTPEGPRLDRALADIDFMVSVDLYLNETTRHADVILPVPSPLERSHYDLAFASLAVHHTAKFSPRVFDTNAPSEVEILSKLALIASGKGAEADPALVGDLVLGGIVRAACADEESLVSGREPEELIDALGDRPIEERILDAMLRTGRFGDGFGAQPDGLSLQKLEANPPGLDLGPLEPTLPEVLQTPSARIELAPESIGADLGRLAAMLDDEPSEGQLLLVGRRDLRSNNSWMHNLESLVSGRPRCTLQLHPRDAAALGLAAGERARVRSSAGELEVPIEATESIRPGVVSLPHGWGHDLPGARLHTAAAVAGVNSNTLTDAEPIDPLSGNATLNAIPVSVERVG